MGIFVKGEVVVFPFPFSDYHTEKLRPALVLAVPRSDEIITCQITKQNTRPEYTIALSKTDFLHGKLEVDLCYIRPNHIFMADPAIVEYSVGILMTGKVQEVIDAAVAILIA